jgi:hypothetical protein
MNYYCFRFSIIPISAGQKISPVRWQIFEERHASLSLIYEWWRGRYSDCGVGIVQGAISRTIVIDVNERPTYSGEKTLADLQARHGKLPPTPTVRTGSGFHLYLTHPGVRIRSGVNVLGPGVDVLGDGSYAVAPPSVHPNGRVYEWVEGHAPGEIGFAALPDWLLAALLDPNRPDRATG